MLKQKCKQTRNIWLFFNLHVEHHIIVGSQIINTSYIPVPGIEKEAPARNRNERQKKRKGTHANLHVIEASVLSTIRYIKCSMF